METAFTPLQSFAGGVLIGLGASLLMAALGRICGATGILSGLLPPEFSSDWQWRISFVAGAVLAPFVILAVTGERPTIAVPAGTLAIIVSGAVIGFGVTLSNGCTSGHGVCGLARFSPRSLAAVVTFMSMTALTVFFTRHVFAG